MIRIKSAKRKNPTDYEFLKKIRIEKTIDFKWGYIDYGVFLNQKQIARMQFDLADNTVFDSNVDSEFRRKGIATYVYDFIEKDLGIKVKPNKTQLDDGVAFWKNRLKKPNPTDYSFLRLLKIEKRKLEFSNDNIMFKYLVKLRGKTIAYAEIFENANYVDDVQIYDEKYRRKGLATYLYDYIEHNLRIKLVPSPIQLHDGEKFWENRIKL